MVKIYKRIIRHGIFETNSSSSHTVTVSNDGDNISYDLNNDVIAEYLDEYGWGGDPCDDFSSKLAYALSMVLHTEYPEFNQYDKRFEIDQGVLESLAGYQILFNAIKSHAPKLERIIIKRHGCYYPYGYIDHQSYEDYSSLKDFLDDHKVDAETFLFNDGVVVYISNDNI